MVKPITLIVLMLLERGEELAIELMTLIVLMHPLAANLPPYIALLHQVRRGGGDVVANQP
jgi:hypothetical protein